ncbi:MAG: hypothetical protein RL535_48 [Pseudomonadota bacterium]|jgi:UDP-glucuronate 4-epimerase
MAKVLVTGGAGFIGAAVILRLLKLGHRIVCLDSLNNYYHVGLKMQRLDCLRACDVHAQLTFFEQNICHHDALMCLFEHEKFDHVIHLAAQAGVRHSILEPHAYMEANMRGFLNVLECCRHYPVKHLVYASSSSVYGKNTKVPFSTEDKTDTPLNLYAASKKSNELMAHSYSHLFGIPTTGLRFFTVYGPWGRPDMAPMLFAEAMWRNKPITVFNQGQMQRDFTYIDDIATAVERVLPLAPHEDKPPYRIMNCGRGQPVDLLFFIRLLADALDKTPKLDFQGMQAGDVPVTWADTHPLEGLTQFKPQISVEQGVERFAAWFKAWKTNNVQ